MIFNRDREKSLSLLFDAYTSLKSSVSNGKSTIATAVTDKGVSTAATASFDTIAANIRMISSSLTLTETVKSSGDANKYLGSAHKFIVFSIFCTQYAVDLARFYGGGTVIVPLTTLASGVWGSAETTYNQIIILKDVPSGCYFNLQPGVASSGGGSWTNGRGFGTCHCFD